METNGVDIWKILDAEKRFVTKTYLGKEIGDVPFISVNNSPFLDALKVLDIRKILSKPPDGNARGYQVKVLLFEYNKLYVQTNIGKLEPQEEDSPLAKFIKDNFEGTNTKKHVWTVLKKKDL